MSTRADLIRIILLQITISALAACTSAVAPATPTGEPSAIPCPTLTPVAVTYNGLALPTPLPVPTNPPHPHPIPDVQAPPVWLIVGDDAILATGGGHETYRCGMVQHADGVSPQEMVDLLATASLPAEAQAVIIVGSTEIMAFQAMLQPSTKEPAESLSGRQLKVNEKREGDVMIFTLEPTGDPADQILAVTITYDQEGYQAGATYLWRLNPPLGTFAPTPNYDQTATAIVQAVVSTVQPKVHASLPSPDKNWRVETIIYDCVQVAEDGPNAYEQLKLIQASDGTETVIDTQLQYCGGVGAYGLGGLYWSPNSRYFYYTDAREGSPDGLCWYWERPIYRMDVLTQAKEFIGEGPLSPDKTKIATWRENDLVIWGLDEGELARIPAAVADAKRGPISWSPDSGSLVYLQTTSDCFPFGKSYVIRFDLPEHRQSLLLESKPISFVHVSWETPDQISLSDEQGNQWNYDLVNSKLEPVP